jgi:putative endonuclease
LKRSVDVDTGLYPHGEEARQRRLEPCSPAVEAAGLSSFETPLRRLLRMRIVQCGGGHERSISLHPSLCRGSYYIGTTWTNPELRIAQHNAGAFGGYISTRCPVTLVFSQWFDRVTDAIENERKLKKWSRAKKEAFIRGDFAALKVLASRRSSHPSTSTEDR